MLIYQPMGIDPNQYPVIYYNSVTANHSYEIMRWVNCACPTAHTFTGYTGESKTEDASYDK